MLEVGKIYKTKRGIHLYDQEILKQYYAYFIFLGSGCVVTIVGTEEQKISGEIRSVYKILYNNKIYDYIMFDFVNNIETTKEKYWELVC